MLLGVLDSETETEDKKLLRPKGPQWSADEMVCSFPYC